MVAGEIGRLLAPANSTTGKNDVIPPSHITPTLLQFNRLPLRATYRHDGEDEPSQDGHGGNSCDISGDKEERFSRRGAEVRRKNRRLQEAWGDKSSQVS